jgi:hypothetical protein
MPMKMLLPSYTLSLSTFVSLVAAGGGWGGGGGGGWAHGPGGGFGAGGWGGGAPAAPAAGWNGGGWNGGNWGWGTTAPVAVTVTAPAAPPSCPAGMSLVKTAGGGWACQSGMLKTPKCDKYQY